MTDTFEKATRLKLRFAVGQHKSVNTEDVWIMPLAQLRDAANELYRNLGSTNDLFEVRKGEDELNKLRLDILVHIITVREAEAEAKTNEKARAEEKKFIRELIQQKQNESLASKSVEELEALLKSQL